MRVGEYRSAGRKGRYIHLKAGLGPKGSCEKELTYPVFW